MRHAITNNKTFRAHERRIESTVQRAITARIINLSVKDICDSVKISRQTFYAHYSGVNDVQKMQEQRLQDDFRKRIGIITNREMIFTMILVFVRENSRYFSVTFNRGDFRILIWMIDYARLRLVPKGVKGCSYYQYRGHIQSLVQVWMLPGYTKEYLPAFVSELLRVRVMRSRLDDLSSLAKTTVYPA